MALNLKNLKKSVFYEGWGYQVPGTSITDGFSKKAVGTRLPIINVYVRLLIESQGLQLYFVQRAEAGVSALHFIIPTFHIFNQVYLHIFTRFECKGNYFNYFQL